MSEDLKQNKPPGPPNVRYRTVPGWPRYVVGSDGSVWARKWRQHSTERIWLKMQLRRKRGGYLDVMLRRDGRSWRVSVHRLVVWAFSGRLYPEKMCLHRNDIPWDNRLENLRWGTAKQNHEDALRLKQQRQQQGLLFNIG